jgi:glutamine amidotransferase PdxT
MAIQATVDLGNGVSATAAYLIIPTAYVKKNEDDDFLLIYDVHIYKNASDRATNSQTKQITCREVDHHKITYDPTTSDNPFKLAYADLKSNGSLSSITDK